jgi:hypothetical protein
VNGDKTYADFGVPGPAPCPSWCAGNHVGSDIGPSGAVIFHGASAIGGGVVVDSHAVTLGMSWVERFDGGAWQPCAPRTSPCSSRSVWTTSRLTPQTGT